MPEDDLSEEFLMALANYHNPETIFKMAKTPWEKAVAIEFFLVKKNQDKTDNEIKWLKWLTKAVFGVTLLAVVVNVLSVLNLFPI